MNLVDTEQTPLHRAFDMVKHGGRGARRDADVERDRRTRAGARAASTPPRATSSCATSRRDMVLERKVRAAIAGGESAERIRRVGRVADARRRAAAASRRTPARSAPRSRRWSPASPSARRSTPPSTPRCARSRCAPRRSATRLGALVAARCRGLRRRRRRVQAARRDTGRREARDGRDDRRSAARRGRRAARDGARLRRRRRARASRWRNGATPTPSSDAGVAALLAEAGARGAATTSASTSSRSATHSVRRSSWRRQPS